MAHVKTGDIVKVIAGKHKGITGKVVSVDTKAGTAKVEGVGIGHRHIKPSQFNPQGGTREIHVGLPLGKLALIVDEKTGATSRVGVKVNDDGTKVRVARQQDNKEIA